MGLSLVSKVAPAPMRGLMMGGWFVATAIGNKLTQIGQIWATWPHSQFWLLLAMLALGMAFVLFALLRPLETGDARRVAEKTSTPDRFHGFSFIRETSCDCS